MAQKDNYGLLLGQDIKLFRKRFREMVRLLGIQVLYYEPRPDKHYTTYTEIQSNYKEPVLVGCIFDEHPTQRTLKKMGWVSELQENSSIIHVDYDLPGLQQGALFSVPSGLDNAENRMFRVVKLSNSIVYPASMTCEIVPEYKDDFERSQLEQRTVDFNLLNQEDTL